MHTKNPLTATRASVMRLAVLLAVFAMVTWGPGALGDHTKPAWEDEAAEDGQAEGDEKDFELDLGTQETLNKIRAFWEHKKVAKHDHPALPDVGVPPRKEELEYYPCMDCHEADGTNDPRIRPLKEDHEDIFLDHGKGRFWCLTCHNLENMDYFRSMTEERIDFNKPYILCGECHAPRQMDWFYGGHGKRIGNWKGEKVSLSCTECHNSHSPSIKPKPPDPPPKRHKGPDGFLANLKKLGFWKTSDVNGKE